MPSNHDNGSDMPMDMGMSDLSMQGGMGDPSMMGGMDDMSMGMDMGDDKSYGADFDAGVQANEEEDPKTYIQQLAGKLSQSLRKYNDNQPQPDVDLNKYVAGMIVSQAVKVLTPKEANEVLNKIKDGSAEKGVPVGDQQDDGQEAPQNGGMDEPQMQ